MDIKVDSKTVVCFDLDDTLYNELDYLMSAYKEIAKHISLKDYKTLFVRMLSLYRKKGDVFGYLSKEYGIEVNQLLKKYRNHKPSIKLFHGAMEVIKKIKAHNGVLVIITDGRAQTQRNKLIALGILNYFDLIVISEEIGTEKPSSNNFETVITNFPDCNYTYIADNFKKDFISPNKLGWQTIGLVDNGKNIHNNSFDYSNKETSPNELIFKFSEINIS